MIIDTFERELEERRRVLGAEHEKVAETLNILGLLYSFINIDLEKALEFHHEAHRILSSKSNCTAETAVITCDIANILLRKGLSEEPMELFTEAITSLKKANVPKTHPVVHSICTRFPYLDGVNLYK